MSNYGRWINSGLNGQVCGYRTDLDHYEERIWPLSPISIYRFCLDADNPLTYQDAAGADWQPDRHYLTDWGSIPNCLAWHLSRTEALGFLLHDSAYSHRGLWRRRPGDSAFTFCRLERDEVDRQLRDSYLAQWHHGGRVQRLRARGRAAEIYAGVWAGGWYAWRRAQPARLRRKAEL